MSVHNGNIHAIKKALASGDMTAQQLSRVTGIQTRKITDAIRDSRKSNHPVYCAGEVLIGKTRLQVYSLTSPVKPTHRTLERPRRYVPEFKAMEPTHYDLWAHRSLAMLGR